MYGVAGFNYNGHTYLYRKNVQGDVTHVYRLKEDKTLELVAQYTYDAWGNCKTMQNVDGIATLNPFRYRSYYFDEETKLYYLQTRYYDPELGRFISADSIEYIDPETLGGLNLYAYCGNNPVMHIDRLGSDWKGFWNKVGNWFTKVGNWINDKIIQPTVTFFKENWDLVLAGVLFVGAIIATVAACIILGPIAVLLSMAAGAIVGTAFGAFNSWLTGGDPLQGAITGFVTGLFGGASGIAGGLAAASMSIIMDRVNGKKAGLDTIKRAAISGIVVGLFSKGGNIASQFVGNGEQAFVGFIVNLAFAGLFTLGNVALDLMKWSLGRKNGK